MRTLPTPIIALVALSCSGNDTTFKPTGNTAPQVVISAPGDGAEYTQIETIDLVATVTDANGLGDVQQVLLISDLQGEIDQPPFDTTGNVRWSGTLGAGTHTLTLEVYDVAGERAEDSITVVVSPVDGTPVAELQSPNDLDSFTAGDNIALLGLASDPNQASDTLTATWSYAPTAGGPSVELWSGSPNGSGIVDSDWLDVPAGSYKVIFAVEDDDGLIAMDQVSVTIEDIENTETFDDDGDCFCESPDTCVGSIEPSCTDLGFDDCDDDNIDLTPGDEDADGVSSCDGDCDDLDDARFPGNTEIALDGLDQDCDGADDCFLDLDEDGFGDGTGPGSNLSCDGVGDAVVDGDCDDDNEDAYPGANEVSANGVDEDCDGMEACYTDVDLDAFGIATLVASSDVTCTTAGTADNAGDCDDGNNAVRPTATELPADGVDQNCDNQELCYQDGDGDGVGGGATTVSNDLTCSAAGLATSSNDCNDAAADQFPGNTETPANGKDNDCNSFEACYVDSDNDDYGNSAGAVQDSADLSCTTNGLANNADDCDDGVDTINPTALEVIGDGVDQDCDLNDECYSDSDTDGYGSDTSTFIATGLTCPVVVLAGDCDDTQTFVNPGAAELTANGIDDDCDGMEQCFGDGDLDGYAGAATLIASPNLVCTDPGEFTVADDCDDAVGGVNPGAADVPDMGFVDDNCDGIDGDVSRAIFVADDGSNFGDCDAAAPCGTIGEAMRRADLDANLDQVFVRTGEYQAFTLVNDVGVYGGYATDWSRTDVLAAGANTNINGRDYTPDSQYVAVRADGVTGTVVQNIRVVGDDVTAQDGAGGGKSSYGIWALGAELVVENVEVIGGAGAPGATGANAADQNQSGAPDGINGKNAKGDTTCNGSGANTGGAASVHVCDSTSTGGGKGGNGGTSDCSNSATANDGQDGNNGLTTNPGQGGDGGDQSSGTASVRNGNDATTNGADGLSGSAGIPGSNSGTVFGGYRSPTTSSAGNAGSPGSGGGGGGGGAGRETFFLTETSGGSGGSGGAGGCGGTGGSGGRGGGASIGIFASSSTVAVLNSEVTAGLGGAGGDGGSGGLAEPGGIGGTGGSTIVVSGLTGPSGGDGSDGGDGGHGAGGSGGGGGPSWGIVNLFSTVDTTGSFIAPGTPGAGGGGGDGAGNAATGAAGTSGQSAGTKVCTTNLDC